VYVWIWRRLPGGWPGKLLGSLVLFAGVCALLFFFVFPWASERLPWNHLTVNDGSNPTPNVSATASP
jgi:hypothetical protein